MSIKIGQYLSREARFKRRQVKGATQYTITFDKLNEVLKAKGFLKVILDILDVERVDSVDSVAKEMAVEEAVKPSDLLRIDNTFICRVISKD